ncbi:MAG: HAD-IA family hydrolase [Pseudomonadota bacterium]
MTSTALLLGSIGVLAETSDLQRRAFNTAFERQGLPWHWDSETYRALLEVPGGKARIRHYGLAKGKEVDVETIYQDKLAAFEALLDAGVPLRPGIAELIADARARGVKVGFVTATHPRQVDMLLRAVQPALPDDTFDFIGNTTFAPAPKPAPDIYIAALYALGVPADHAVAIEDTPDSAQSALAAGVRTYAYPGTGAAHRSFPKAVTVLDRPDAGLLPQRSAAA